MNICTNQYGITFDLENHDKVIGERAVDDFVKYLKKNFRIGVNTIDDVVKNFKEQNK